MRKTVNFDRLKPGDKFRYNRKLYILDAAHIGIRLSNGELMEFATDIPVTPVKLMFRAR